MPHVRSGSGLASLPSLVGKELQGDKAVELGVLSFIDDAHPATTEFLYDAVVGDGAAENR